MRISAHLPLVGGQEDPAMTAAIQTKLIVPVMRSGTTPPPVADEVPAFLAMVVVPVEEIEHARTPATMRAQSGNSPASRRTGRP